jgi:serine/threonine protein kinase/tetratricopeptide (TPR) repeat protein
MRGWTKTPEWIEMASANDVRGIFLAAVERPPAERAAYLDEVCAGDAVLRQRVEALLRAHDEPGGFLSEASASPGPLEQTMAYRPPPGQRPGDLIAGRYKLLEAIGEGGMGSVWVAEQTEPVRRKVAVKLIKAGMDSKSVLARFEAERQALAVMDHPNIAKVLDGGLTDAGRPFFVMEYVKGVSITEYCDATRLSVPDRLNLFVQVCQAVQHAHQKGIIHRDLKPSNILVAPYDDKPVPKVIDFGLAKAMNQSLTERTLHTAHETVLGTPLYMSPEQAQLNNLDVDTRSDVYSLGVLLYELLTGTTPLEKQRFKEAAWEEVKRIIREEEPPRPSARLSSTQTLPSLAASRQMEPVKLTKLVRGELDWIVMKALEKDRSRRYDTVNGLAADVQRYLASEPVQAHPPSTTYRLRKFGRRHKGRVTAAGLLLLSLVGGIVGTTTAMMEARKQERIAVASRQTEAAERLKALAERDEKQKALKIANAETKRADEEAAVAKAVNDFLQFDLLRHADTRFHVVDRANPNRDPNIKVRDLLGRAAKAVDKLKDRPLVEAAIQNILADTYVGLGLGAVALPHARRAVELREKHLGPKDLATLASKCTLAFDMDPHEAVPILHDILREYEARLPQDHPETLRAKLCLAMRYLTLRRFERSGPLFKELLAKLSPHEGVDSVTHFGVKVLLAGQYVDERKDAEAESVFKELMASPLWKDWRNFFDGRCAVGGLARFYGLQGKYDAAESLYHEVIAATISANGPESEPVFDLKGGLVALYVKASRLSAAETLAMEIAEFRRKRDGAESSAYSSTLAKVGMCRLQQSRAAEAEPVLRQCLAIREKTQPDAWTTFNTQSMLGGALLGQKKFTEAEPLLLKGYEGMKARERAIPQQALIRIPEAVDRLIELYAATNKPDEAKKWKAVRAMYPPKDGGQR